MRIANNIMAMNTHRSYTNNNDRVSTSAEKLSSGYRINKAGDDAAGLAISEKMRSQIRGLNMATRNSQDAISLVQTAEGALQEVHSMLQRMNELAVQSATGTNEEFDRTQIAKEFSQLKREINDISEQTTFNNMKLLDGSLSNDGARRSAATTGIFTGTTEVSTDAKITQTVAPKGVAEFAGVKGEYTIDISSMSMSGGSSGVATMTIGGMTFTSAAFDATTNGTSADIAGAFDGVSSNGWTLSDNGDGTLSLKQDTVTAAGVTPPTIGTAAIAHASATATGSATTTEVAKPEAAVTAVAEKNTIGFVNAPKAGDVFAYNGKEYEFVVAGEEGKRDGAITVEVGADADTSVANLAAKVSAEENGAGKVTVAANGSNLEITQVAGEETIQTTRATFTPSKTQNATVEFDLAKLKVGDQVTVKVTNQTTGVESERTYVHNEGNGIEDIADALSGLNGTRKGNTIYFENSEAKVEFQAGPEEYQGGPMRIQVGALENEQLNINITAMNTAGLSLDDAEIYDQDSAGKAITSTRDAINLVSDQSVFVKRKMVQSI